MMGHLCPILHFKKYTKNLLSQDSDSSVVAKHKKQMLLQNVDVKISNLSRAMHSSCFTTNIAKERQISLIL